MARQVRKDVFSTGHSLNPVPTSSKEADVHVILCFPFVSSNPDNILSKVDLPAPFFPLFPTSPRSTSKLMPVRLNECHCP
jgi:hypothetical protein